jgi:hypothetical protein
MLVGGGCASNDEIPPVTVPRNAELIGLGRFDSLVLTIPHPGRVYFVEEPLGRVVYVISAPGSDRPERMAQASENIKKIFSPDRIYRVYFVPSTGRERTGME